MNSFVACRSLLLLMLVLLAIPAQPARAQSTDNTAGPSDQTAEPPPPPAPIRTIFMAPLVNEAGDEQYDPLAAGVGELLEALLSTGTRVRMVDRLKFREIIAEHALRLKGLAGGKSAIEVGRLLNADTAIFGRLYAEENRLVISVQALDIATARVLASRQMPCRPEDLLDTAAHLAQALAQQLATPLPPIDLKQIDKSPLAGLHFARALSCYYAGNLDEALMHLMRTIDLDPDFLDVHYWSGMCYFRQEAFDHAVIEWESLLRRAPGSIRAAAVADHLAEARARVKALLPPEQRIAPSQDESGQLH